MCFTTAFSTVKRWRITGERVKRRARTPGHRGARKYLRSPKCSTPRRVRSAAVPATPVTRITIAAGTTRADAVFAKITADGSEIQVLAATRARERPLAIRFGRAERREGKRRIRVRIKKIFVRIRPTRTFETLAVAVAITTPREAITATLSPLKSVQGKAFKRTQLRRLRLRRSRNL